MEFLFFLFLFFCFCFFVEAYRNPNFSGTKLLKKLFMDILKLLKSLFDSEKSRHQFDGLLGEDFRGIVKPYAHPCFAVQCSNVIFRNVPAIFIRFVASQKLDDDELQTIARLVHLKFKDYLKFYSLNWLSFLTYSEGEDFYTVCIYYAEFPDDIMPFRNMYRRQIREVSNAGGTMIYDDDLEKELRDVD